MKPELEGAAVHAHAVHEEAPTHPSTATYYATGILTFLITAMEIAVVRMDALAGVMKPTIIVLLGANFTIAALYYQGLQYDNGLNKLIFGVGAVLGVLVAVSLLVLLQLGLNVK